MITIKGKNYVKMGDKLVEVAQVVNGQPVLKTHSVEITRPDGRKDCTIHVECLQIVGRKE